MNLRPSVNWEREALEADEVEAYEIMHNLTYECDYCGSNNPHVHNNTCDRGSIGEWSDEYVPEEEADLVLISARYAQ